MKKGISALFAALTAACTLTALPFTAAAADTGADVGFDPNPHETAVIYRYGDANLDQSVSMTDVTEIQKLIAGLSFADNTAEQVADTNFNGAVDIGDATCVQNYLAEITGGAGRTGQNATIVPLSEEPYAWPVPGCYYISTPYDYSECSTEYGDRGISICGKQGTPIVAADDGAVVSIKNGCNHDYPKSENCGCDVFGFGNLVSIEHRNGKGTLYYHLSEVSVELGQEIKKGDVIGTMGSTGSSAGFHVHVACYYGGEFYDANREFPYK